MARIRRMASDPAQFRFIVVMRDPLMRAFSEWNMFATKYHWDRDSNFSTAMARKVWRLYKCDPDLFRNTARLLRLSTPALGRYIRRCFGGGRAMEYLATSLYAVCIEHALRLFSRKQFLFLRFEDLKRMQPAAVIRIIARFTGLSAEAALTDATALKKCTARRKKPHRSNSVLRNEAEQLATVTAPLERIFDPYNHMLSKIVHPALRWSMSSHVK